jgi:hypothetical protein
LTPTVNTNTGLTPNTCTAINNPFACLTPPPSAAMTTPRADTTVPAATTTLRIYADFVSTNTVANCSIDRVKFVRDNDTLGDGIALSASRFYFDVILPGNGSSNYYSAYGDLTDGPANFYRLQTSAVRISQVIVGLDEKFKTVPFSVYPNPASTALNLKFEGGEAGYNVSIIDGLGRTVHKTTTNADITPIELPSLARGLYRVVVGYNGHQRSVNLAIK